MPKFKVEGEKGRYDLYKVDSRGPYTVTKGELALSASRIQAAAEANEVRTVPHFITLAVILAANEAGYPYETGRPDPPGKRQLK